MADLMPPFACLSCPLPLTQSGGTKPLINNRPKFLTGRLLLLLAVFCLTTQARATEQVSLQLRWHHQFQFAGYYAALEKGFYKEVGLDVSIKEGGIGVNTETDVLSGKSDFGVGVSSLVLDYLKGKPVVMLAPIFQHSPNVLLVHGRDKLPEDLIGAGKIALMNGDQDVELKAMFLDEGIALDKLDFAPDVLHLQDFLEHRVAGLYGYTSNEPFELERRKIPFSILRPQTYGMDFYGDSLFTSQRLAKERPQAVAAFRAASLRGWEYAFEHPDEIIDLILARYNTEHKSREHLAFEAKELHRLAYPEVIAIGHNNPGRWEYIAKTFRRFGLTDSKRPLDDFIFQPERKIDLTWFYRTVFTISLGLLVVGGIALYIYRVNRQLTRALEDKSRSEEYHRVIFQTSASAGIVWRENGVISDWNRRAEEVFGWSRQEVLGRQLCDFLLPQNEKERIEPKLLQMLEADKLPHSINDNLTRDGRTITCEWFNALLPGRPGEAREVVSLAIDITERIRLEKEIQALAFYDPLTHLPNRRLLLDRFGLILANQRRHGGRGALLFLDLDNFKPLNDAHGHKVGDIFLIEVARRLQECTRAIDTLARLGGDEFLVLIGDLDADAYLARFYALQLADKIRLRLAEPYQLTTVTEAQAEPQTIEHHCTVSIGVALFDGNANEDEVMLRADTAMYRAKKAGRNQVIHDDLADKDNQDQYPVAAGPHWA